MALNTTTNVLRREKQRDDTESRKQCDNGSREKDLKMLQGVGFGDGRDEPRKECPSRSWKR